MDTKTQSAELSSVIDIGILDLNDAVFAAMPGGFTGLTVAGKEYKRISLRRAMPVGRPDSYISVADQENKEIAIIRNLSELSPDQLAIVAAELDRRYYCPRIYEILSVKDKLGYVYMELLIGSDAEKFTKNAAVKDVNKNIRMLDDDRLIIFDVDGNRYIVEDLSGLDKKSLKRLEPYLF